MNRQEESKRPDYSPFAGQYALSRPTYPPDLFAYLASLVQRHCTAWDCATGNGQAALGLAPFFDRVIATDISAEQIRHAVIHPKIEYQVAATEHSGLADRSVDLATAASAMHWFDLDRFYAEVRRVVRPGGVLAAWTYHVAYTEPPFDRLLERFYREVVFSYFAAGARIVDNRYQAITLPGEPIDSMNFHMSATWNLSRMVDFIRSWSGTQEYVRKRGEDPTSVILDELESLWGHREKVHTVRWPLYMRISRL